MAKFEAHQHLFDAAHRGQVHILDEWLARRAGDTQELQAALLRVVIDRDDVRAVECFLRHGVDANIVGQDQSAPLAWAAMSGNGAVVETLLRYAADVHHQDVLGCSALHYAAFHKHLRVVRLLLDAGAQVSLKNVEGRSPLDLSRLWRFSCRLPFLGSGGGVVRSLWDGQVSRVLRSKDASAG
jgi:ankyrin repeat protein